MWLPMLRLEVGDRDVHMAAMSATPGTYGEFTSMGENQIRSTQYFLQLDRDACIHLRNAPGQGSDALSQVGRNTAEKAIQLVGGYGMSLFEGKFRHGRIPSRRRRQLDKLF